MEEKIQALMENAEFAAKMEQAESVAELVALFNAEGVEVTEDAVKQALEKIENEELDEAALENVSGGFVAIVVAGIAIATWLYVQLLKKYGDSWKKHVK